jgi:hypothetical protein
MPTRGDGTARQRRKAGATPAPITGACKGATRERPAPAYRWDCAKAVAGLRSRPRRRTVMHAPATASRVCPGARSQEHVPQKREPVLRKRTCSNKELEQDGDSKKSHPAPGVPGKPDVRTACILAAAGQKARQATAGLDWRGRDLSAICSARRQAAAPTAGRDHLVSAVNTPSQSAPGGSCSSRAMRAA